MATKNISLANPQGKASIAILNDLQSFNPVNVKTKNIPRWLTDLFTSLLVLSAKFSFKPVINKEYYLYFDHDQLKLSLIEPHAWRDCPYIFFAACRLHEDKSWSIEPTNDWENNHYFLERINEMRQAFFDALNTNEPMINSLPYYAGHLPYHQRVAANGLAKSLRQSLKLELGTKYSKIICGKELINIMKNIGHSPLSLLKQI
ncbi:MAG: hypothetical protein AB8B89_00435 [Gammaproteobacteria bacterium]